jgi:hypothetical protein
MALSTPNHLSVVVKGLLKDEITKSVDLTVLPAFGSQARQSVPTGTNPMKLVASKRAISWADVVKKAKR